jgi:MinD superfamily P-loop ATPase
LVSLVKERAIEAAGSMGLPLILVDGPPGIACPAIAALSGADLVLIVAEPTLAGLTDLERAEGMADHFHAHTQVCINKADLHPEGAVLIRDRCKARGVPVIASVPFDEAVVEALVMGRPVTEYRPNSPASEALAELWEKLRGPLLG